MTMTCNQDQFYVCDWKVTQALCLEKSRKRRMIIWRWSKTWLWPVVRTNFMCVTGKLHRPCAWKLTHVGFFPVTILKFLIIWTRSFHTLLLYWVPHIMQTVLPAVKKYKATCLYQENPMSWLTKGIKLNYKDLPIYIDQTGQMITVQVRGLWLGILETPGGLPDCLDILIHSLPTHRLGQKKIIIDIPPASRLHHPKPHPLCSDPQGSSCMSYPHPHFGGNSFLLEDSTLADRRQPCPLPSQH